MANRGIYIPEFSALNQFVDPMAQAGKFAAQFSAKKSAEEAATLDRLLKDKLHQEEWDKRFELQEAANKRVTPISGTVSITSPDGDRSATIPYSQLNEFTTKGWVVGKKNSGSDGATGSDGPRGSTYNGDAYNKLREEVMNYGFFDKNEAVKNIDVLQAYGVDPTTVKSALIKMEADSMIDNTLTRDDLDKYLPKVVDSATGSEIGFGKAVTEGESKGLKITMDDKGRYTLVNTGNKVPPKSDVLGATANTLGMSLYNALLK